MKKKEITLKEAVCVSLGAAKDDYEFTTEFLGQSFRVRRFGADRDRTKAAALLQKWDGQADVLSLGQVKEHYSIGTQRFVEPETAKLEALVTRSPITSGTRLRHLLQRWAVRHVQLELGNCFNNANVLFLSGMLNYEMATVMAEYTPNLCFADPLLQLGIPKLLTSLKSLEMFAMGSHQLLNWTPSKLLASPLTPMKEWNGFVLRKAMQKSHAIVGPFPQIEHWAGLEELAGKTIVTSTLTDERVAWLKEQGVNLAVDISPQIFPHVVGINVLDALIIGALEKNPEDISNDDYLDILRDLQLTPRLIYPQGRYRKVNRFAFVIHPLSQEYFKKVKPIEVLSQVTPPAFMTAVEKAMAYAPPFVYSSVTGIKSPQGVETEGWLLSVGGTPKEILAHSPEFTYRRLLAAADLAQKLGAQMMGLGAFTKVVGDAGVTVAKRAPLPITTGNSYSASAALWAAGDAMRRMGLITMEKGKKVQAKAMVVGATGAIGSVCSRLLAKVTAEVYLVSPQTDKLLEIQQSIQEETPEAKVYITSRVSDYIAEMDMIVTATSGAGKKVLDIMQVKPGCVITDVARPLDLPPSEVAKRPDVLVIESGEILLPGEVKMKNIGLPPGVAYACLAETIVLALEGRFEVFTIGRNIEWEKVREIYRLGIKHGMRLAAISGVNGVFSDEDIAKVRQLALSAREKAQKKSA